MKNVLITGVTGFLGKHLVNALKMSDYSIIGLTRQHGYESLSADIITGDLRDREFTIDLVKKTRPNIIFHLAVNKTRINDINGLRHSLEDNLFGTLNLVEACIDKPYMEKFVSFGSCEEYGASNVPFREEMNDSPDGPYSLSKSAVKLLLQTVNRSNNFPSIILRPSVVYGPGQESSMFVPALINALMRKERFSMSGGEQSRDYIFIDDLIEAILIAINRDDAIGKVINISSGTSILLKDLAHLIADRIGDNSKDLIDIGAIDYRKNDIMKYVASNRLAKDILSWMPKTTIESGISRTIEYFRHNI